MRILLVTSSYFPVMGGSEVLTRMLSIKLNEMGIHTDIMTFNMDEKWNPIWKEETINNGTYKVLREPAFNPLPHLPNPMFSLFRMNVVPRPSFLRNFRDYDVIHFIGEADLSFLLLSYFIRKPKLLQCVGIFKNGGIYRYYAVDRVYLGKIFRRLFSRLADKFAISSNQERGLLIDMGIPQSKILNLPIGVDTDIFTPVQTKKSDNLVLFVGRIDRIKGLHIVMKALRYLQVPVQLVIAGPRWDPKYVAEIEEMSNVINEEGVHKVNFLGGLDQNDLIPWYQRASILVCPYQYEDHSNVVRESLACGTPVLSTGTHISENGNDGILISSRNPKEVADAIRKLLEDRAMRERYGRAGRELVEQYFSWASVVKKLIRVYQDMLIA